MPPTSSGPSRARGARLDEPTATDAWIFASIAAGRRATTLADLVVGADSLNHAIPSAVEVRSALVRLAARRLVVARGQALSLSALGRRVHADGRARRGGLFSIVDNMRRAMRSPRHRTEPDTAPPRFAFVTDAAMARAAAAHQRACAARVSESVGDGAGPSTMLARCLPIDAGAPRRSSSS